MKESNKNYVAGTPDVDSDGSALYITGGIKSVSFNSSKVILDGKELDLGGQQMISIVKDGEQDACSYMPVCGVLQAMGNNVDWNGQKQAFIVTSPQSGIINAPKPEASGDIVYLITMDRMDQHLATVNEGAKDMAAALGLAYKWDSPPKKDNAGQIAAVKNALTDGAKVILLSANDPVAVSAAIRDAKEKGIKFIYVDSPANEPAMAVLATNNYSAGQLAANIMLDEFNAAGISHGKIGIIGVNTATDSTIARENGFRDVIEKNGNFTILTTEYKNGEFWASQVAAASFIKDNKDLVGLYGTNEGATFGVGNAIKDSGKAKTIVGIGYDKPLDIQYLLNNGSLKATLVQNSYSMGYLGMAQAYAAINGLHIDSAVTDTGVTVLRKG